MLFDKPLKSHRLKKKTILFVFMEINSTSKKVLGFIVIRKSPGGWSEVAHSCNPSYLEMEV
jgi:hypothetical protein